VEEIIQVENGETSTPKNKVTQLKAPYAGMVFETMEEARNYYEEYGRQEGFWIRTRSSSKTRRHLDMVTSRQFVCAHEGKYVPKNTSQKASEENDERDISEIENMKRTGKNCSTVKCGCKASMRIKLDRWSNKRK
ncbi:PREDICTED: FAR1-RELATED SEQUENCE, partial [Prunus dulcis]